MKNKIFWILYSIYVHIFFHIMNQHQCHTLVVKYFLTKFVQKHFCHTTSIIWDHCKIRFSFYIGWQSRWFILDDGVLSYFKSYDEVSQGCKGSISLNVCEIVVNPNDVTRLDLNVSNEQYLYLRANNEKERQKWLVALGSAKAGMANR